MNARFFPRCAAALAVLLCCAATLHAAAVQVKPLDIGTDAPDFSLPGVDGKTYTLKDFEGAKVLVICFTSNHCPTAQAYEPRLKQFVTEYAPKGVKLVAINPNSPKGLRLDELGYTDLGDTFEDMKARAARAQFNFPYIDDGATQVVSKAYGCLTTPHVFVFDAARKLRYQGRIDDAERPERVKVSDMKNAVDALLEGKEVAVPVTKPFGCSTKWAEKSDDVAKWLEKVEAEPVALDDADDAALNDVLSAKTGRLRLVKFWEITCGPCIEEMPHFVELNRMYRRRAFDLVSVTTSPAANKTESLAVLKKMKMSNRNLQYTGSAKEKIYESFGVEGGRVRLPYHVLIDGEGKIVYKKEGTLDAPELRNKILDILGRMIDEKKK